MQYENQKYADISKIVSYLGDEIVSCIPQFHSLTGCDTTSYFFNRGKISVINRILKNSTCIQLIQGLGKELVLSNSSISDAMKFIQAVVYAGKSNEDYVTTRVRLYQHN